MILFTIMILFALLFTIFLISTNMLPFKYLILIIIFLLIFLIGLFFLLVFKTKKKNKKRKVFGYVLSGILTIIMIFIFYFIFITFSIFDNGKQYKEENFLVLVLKDSNFQSLKDLNNIGYTLNELSNVDKAINELNKEISIENISYDNMTSMFDDLINQEIDSTLIEESSMNMIYEEYEEYEDKFRILYTINIKTEIEIAKKIDVTEQTFTVYISGIDSYGSIATVSRSDVNMVATINPKTKQVLLLSIPRDYYVQLRGTSGYKDKLTHAGLYGIETSVGTLEDLLATDINYYVRVNFSSLENIVDALGGVDVYSKYSFTSSQASGGTYYFATGYNHMNGKQALAFSRERKALPGGDRARGINQQAVIDGLIRKATSPAIITGYVKILNSLKNSFQTNMTESDIQKLIKMQLGDMASWNITSYSLDGTDSSNYTYSVPTQKLYVMEPEKETVLEAQSLIDKVIAGEILESSYDKEASDVKDPVYVEPKPEPEPEEPEITGTLPTITFDNDITIIKGQNYDLMTGVTVNDIEDELLNLKPTVTTDITDTSVLEIGTYTITYTVSDSDGNSITATRNLVVLLDVIDLPIDQEDSEIELPEEDLDEENPIIDNPSENENQEESNNQIDSEIQENENPTL